MCDYCNFRTNPPVDGSTAAWMTPGAAAEALQKAAEVHRVGPGAQGMQASLLVEALVMAGEVSPTSPRRPAWLNAAVEVCRVAAEAGRLPHTNIGPLSRGEMVALRGVNVSMGLMVEQVTPSLRLGPTGVHRFAPSKEPALRLQQVVQAGELRIPFTTGLLAGIGETWEDSLATLDAIADVAEEGGHVQEVIIQPHTRGTSQRGRHLPHFDLQRMPDLVAHARQVLPSDVVVQVPPNLALREEAPLEVLLGCLEAGARDLGGLSPRDEVNPDWPFPDYRSLAASLRQHGWHLRPRTPVHSRFVNASWVHSPALLSLTQWWEGALPGLWAEALGSSDLHE